MNEGEGHNEGRCDGQGNAEEERERGYLGKRGDVGEGREEAHMGGGCPAPSWGSSQ